MISTSSSTATGLPVHNVDTGLDYATIQEALTANETLNGHRIYVESGTYHENLIVNKSVSLLGQNKFNTTIIGSSPKDIIYVTVGNVRIAGFTVKQSAYGYSSIYFYSSDNNNVTDNIVEGSYYGVDLYNSTNSILYCNLITDCEYGIRLYNSTNNNITTNVLTSNRNAIHLDISRRNRILQNNISSNLWNGIYLHYSLENAISNNVIGPNNIRGIRVHDSGNNTISGNLISGNLYSLNLYNSIGNLICDNTVTTNNKGIELMDSNRNVISANNISNNSQYGLRLLNSSDNKMFHNNFINNTPRNLEQPSNTSFGNLWDNFVEGNYWSDQKSIDANEDGISDTPYITDERTYLGIHSRDSYPLMGPFQLLNVPFQNQSYSIEIISNSTITDAQYGYDQKKEEYTLVLKSTNNGNISFCRLRIPYILVEPPYTITISNKTQTYNNTIRSDDTSSWIYVRYNSPENVTTIIMSHTIIPTLQTPIWAQPIFWELLGLTALAIILSSINIKYHRTINKQKGLLQLYEEKLEKADPIVIARELFATDVQRRKHEITKFAEKYNLKIQPRNSLDDIVGKIKSRKKENKEQKSD